MKKADAIRSFAYWGNQIYTPLGKHNARAERMRGYWAKAIDSGFYKKLPNDAVASDDTVEKKYKR